MRQRMRAMGIALITSVLALATAGLAAGCGGGGYRVVRSDPSVELEHQHWVVLPSVASNDQESLRTEALEHGLESALAEHWNEREVARGPAVERGHGVRVHVERVTRLEEETSMQVRVHLVDETGRTHDEIAAEVRTTTASDHEHALGRALAGHVVSFVRERSAHHH
jgi:hypothetical protein